MLAIALRKSVQFVNLGKYYTAENFAEKKFRPAQLPLNINFAHMQDNLMPKVRAKS